jgi:hypothetical protein
METINGLSPTLRKIAISGMLVAPVIATLGLKVAGLVSALAGSGGLISLIGGSGGVAAALTALTGPVGIAIAAIGLLAGAWAANLGNMRTKTKRWAADMKSLITGTFQSLESRLNDETPWAATPAEEKALRERQSDKSGGGNTSSGSEKYLGELEKLKQKDFSTSVVAPSKFESQGQKAGRAAAQGVQQGLSQAEMKASIIKDQQDLKSLRLLFKKADSLSRKKELLKKMQAIRNPENMNQPTPSDSDRIRRLNQGGAPRSKTGAASVASSTPIVQASKGIERGGTKIQNVAQTFSKAVSRFEKAVQNMEVVVTVSDGEFAQAVDARVQQQDRQTAQTTENYGVYQG